MMMRGGDAWSVVVVVIGGVVAPRWCTRLCIFATFSVPTAGCCCGHQSRRQLAAAAPRRRCQTGGGHHVAARRHLAAAGRFVGVSGQARPKKRRGGGPDCSVRLKLVICRLLLGLGGLLLLRPGAREHQPPGQRRQLTRACSCSRADSAATAQHRYAPPRRRPPRRRCSPPRSAPPLRCGTGVSRHAFRVYAACAHAPGAGFAFLLAFSPFSAFAGLASAAALVFPIVSVWCRKEEEGDVCGRWVPPARDATAMRASSGALPGPRECARRAATERRRTLALAPWSHRRRKGAL